MGVVGLDKFKQHFAAFNNQYILIGGSACYLAMNEVGASFRATKDLDIVLCVEALEDAFIASFWSFVEAGQYRQREESVEARQYYRFQAPAIAGYPVMMELFSRKPDIFSLPSDCRLTPIPTIDYISSLSAILLDDEYYEWIRQGACIVDGVSIVGAEHLVPLKARAWLDLGHRRDSGDHVDSRDIKKHRNDIFRLFSILTPTALDSVPLSIQRDMMLFLEKIQNDSVNLKQLGLSDISLSDVLVALSRIYGLKG